MKCVILAMSGLLFLTATSSAQLPGTIGVYADEGGTDCNVVDDGGIFQAHILHVRTTGATAAVFKLDISATEWTYLGESWDFGLIIGNAVEGISISYRACYSGTFHLGYASFTGSSAPACTEISIVPSWHSLIGEIEVTDCEVWPEAMIARGGRAFVNANRTCQCVLPVNETTWGGVKALYN